MTEYRAEFDAEVTFANGGGLQAQGFRLDVPGADVGEEQLADLFVRHLGLLMVGGVVLRNVRVLAEPHKGSRGGPADRPAVAGTAGGRLIDLSHVIEADRAGNTGTRLAGPFDQYADGADLSGLPLTALADLPLTALSDLPLTALADLPLTALADLPLVVVRLQDMATRAIGPDVLRPIDLAGRAVLLHTGWDRHWGSETYGREAPYLTGPAAQSLADAGARLVGIDSVNLDDLGDRRRPAHSILLRAGIPILEHLTGLDRAPVTGARLHAAPPRIRGFGTYPVRAYAVLPA